MKRPRMGREIYIIDRPHGNVRVSVNHFHETAFGTDDLDAPVYDYNWVMAEVIFHDLEPQPFCLRDLEYD